MPTLYNQSRYQETAFSFPGVHQEARFLQSCIHKFSDIAVRRVAQVGCGYAPHAGELVRLGYSYIGLDSNRNMLDYAAYRWRYLRPTPEFIEGDTISFALDKKVDFAFVMHGALCLNSLEEMTSHFDSMAAALRPGGLYSLDWCIQFADPLTPRASSVTIGERGLTRPEPRFDVRLIDSTRQVHQSLRRGGAGERRHNRLLMIEHSRAVFPREFLLFIKSLSVFEFVGWWKDWDLSRPIEGEGDVDRSVVLVMRK